MADVTIGNDPSPGQSPSSTTTDSSTSSPAILDFPNDVRDMYHFVKISSFQYVREQRGVVPQNPGYTGHVILPLPANVMASYSANWGSSGFEPIQTVAINNAAMGSLGKKFRDNGLVGGGEKVYNEISKSIQDLFSGVRKQQSDLKKNQEDQTTRINIRFIF